MSELFENEPAMIIINGIVQKMTVIEITIYEIILKTIVLGLCIFAEVMIEFPLYPKNPKTVHNQDSCV